MKAEAQKLVRPSHPVMSQSHLSAEITEAKSCLLSTQQEGIAEKLISAPSLRSPPQTVSFGPVREDRK